MRALPWVTVSVVGAAIVVHAAPAAGAWLVYDRLRVADGDAWRLLTGSLVHVSTGHLVMDVAAFGIAGAIIERRERGAILPLCALALVAVGAAVHALAPELARYAGLSGLAFAALAYLGLGMMTTPGRTRAIGVAATAVLLAKLALDLSRPAPLLLDAGAGVVAAPVSHLAGAASAALVALWRGGSWAAPAPRRSSGGRA